MAQLFPDVVAARAFLHWSREYELRDLSVRRERTAVWRDFCHLGVESNMAFLDVLALRDFLLSRNADVNQDQALSAHHIVNAMVREARKMLEGSASATAAPGEGARLG